MAPRLSHEASVCDQTLCCRTWPKSQRLYIPPELGSVPWEELIYTLRVSSPTSGAYLGDMAHIINEPQTPPSSHSPCPCPPPRRGPTKSLTTLDDVSLILPLIPQNKPFTLSTLIDNKPHHTRSLYLYHTTHAHSLDLLSMILPPPMRLVPRRVGGGGGHETSGYNYFAALNPGQITGIGESTKKLGKWHILRSDLFFLTLPVIGSVVLVGGFIGFGVWRCVRKKNKKKMMNELQQGKSGDD